MLPKHLDEKVAELHLEHLGVELESLSEEQASYIGVKVKGPYRPFSSKWFKTLFSSKPQECIILYSYCKY